jgi:outer membrane protein assembly factor BamD
MSAYPVGWDRFFGYFSTNLGDWTGLALRMTAALSTFLKQGGRNLRFGVALVALALPLGACSSMGGGGSMFDKLFGKEEAAVDQPADKLYNEGLYLLNQEKKSVAAAKRFEEV